MIWTGGEDDTLRLSWKDLRSWGQSLDKETPRSLGQTLMRYADEWRKEIEELETDLATAYAAAEKLRKDKD